MNQCVFLGLLTGIWVRGYLKEQKWFKDSCIIKAHSNTGGISQELGNLEPTHVAQLDDQLTRPRPYPYFPALSVNVSPCPVLLFLIIIGFFGGAPNIFGLLVSLQNVLQL